MNLLILHLSDIHLKKEGNAVIAKVNGLRGVIEAHAANVDACVIAISGDIAYSGKDTEYAIAAQLLEGVRSACAECSLTNYVCCIPGNHDCDFDKADRTREIVIRGILDEHGKNVDESVVGSCIKIQDAFFDFLKSETSSNPTRPLDRLAYVPKLEQKEKKIGNNSINSACIDKLQYMK
jgi:predicted MPP superfamily phosphohydrolase